MKHIKGDIEQYDNELYKVIENNITPRKKKKEVLIKLNVIAIIIWLILSIVTFLAFNVANQIVFNLGMIVNIAIILVTFVVYIVIHELLHAIAFILFDPNIHKKDIKFGVSLKSGVAYCIATKPVTVKASRISLMMPIYVVCIPMYIISILLGNVVLALIAVYFFIGSIGDFYYLYLLRHSKKNQYIKENLPTKSGYEIGYILYEKQ